MKIKILGTESLGVRGLSCVVITKNRKIVIDPGIALGYNRHGLLPHPFQVAVGERIRQKIIKELRDATDVVFSHYHGDHIPLPDANPYQLSAKKVVYLLQKPHLWCKGPDGLSYNMIQRSRELSHILGRTLPNVEGQTDGVMSFSLPMPHGELNNGLGTVMMTRIKDGDGVFVHASDIQLLNKEAILQILRWQPDIVLVSGPPLYLPYLSSKKREEAWHNAICLSQGVDTLILDHHLLRFERGSRWLDKLSSRTRHKVICAADFMRQPRRLLEAWRRRLYKELPVPDGWHEKYAHGKVNTLSYRKWRNWDLS
jgi:hypothetical protein